MFSKVLLFVADPPVSHGEGIKTHNSTNKDWYVIVETQLYWGYDS